MFVLPSNALHCGREADDERSRVLACMLDEGSKKLAAPNNALQSKLYLVRLDVILPEDKRRAAQNDSDRP